MSFVRDALDLFKGSYINANVQLACSLEAADL